MLYGWFYDFSIFFILVLRPRLFSTAAAKKESYSPFVEEFLQRSENGTLGEWKIYEEKPRPFLERYAEREKAGTIPTWDELIKNFTAVFPEHSDLVKDLHNLRDTVSSMSDHFEEKELLEKHGVKEGSVPTIDWAYLEENYPYPEEIKKWKAEFNIDVKSLDTGAKPVGLDLLAKRFDAILQDSWEAMQVDKQMVEEMAPFREKAVDRVRHFYENFDEIRVWDQKALEPEIFEEIEKNIEMYNWDGTEDFERRIKEDAYKDHH